MTTQEFNALFEQTVQMCRETLCAKADEYAEDDDRLHNFNTAAVLQGETPIKSLGGMAVKHTVSVYDLIRRHNRGVEITQEIWDEKLKDSINYLILLRAAVAEQRGVDQPAIVPVPVHIPGCDTCACCGEDIPEGNGMVCRQCWHKYGEPK